MKCAPDGIVNRQRGHYADDPEQSRLCRGATSSRTNGGNGAVFQNWAQYLLTMKYLSEDRQQPCIQAIQWDCFHLIKKHQG
jgi:hypothetical protein